MKTVSHLALPPSALRAREASCSPRGTSVPCFELSLQSRPMHAPARAFSVQTMNFTDSSKVFISNPLISRVCTLFHVNPKFFSRGNPHNFTPSIPGPTPLCYRATNHKLHSCLFVFIRGFSPHKLRKAYCTAGFRSVPRNAIFLFQSTFAPICLSTPEAQMRLLSPHQRNRLHLPRPCLTVAPG